MYLCRKHKSIGRAEKCPQCLLKEKEWEFAERDREIKQLKGELNTLNIQFNTVKESLENTRKELKTLKPYVDISDKEIAFRKSEIESVVKSLVWAIILERENDPLRNRGNVNLMSALSNSRASTLAQRGPLS